MDDLIDLAERLTFEELADLVEAKVGLDERVLLEIVGWHQDSIGLWDICVRFNSDPQRALRGLLRLGDLIACHWVPGTHDLHWSLDSRVARAIRTSRGTYVHIDAPGVR